MRDGGKGGRKCGTTWPKWNLWHEIMGLDFCGVGRSGRSFRINLQARGVLRTSCRLSQSVWSAEETMREDGCWDNSYNGTGAQLYQPADIFLGFRASSAASIKLPVV